MDSAYYEPQFTKKDRDGQLSLWVEMPDGGEWNIYDIEYEYDNPKVMNAIIHAFELGMKANEMMINYVTCYVSSLAKFKEVE